MQNELFGNEERLTLFVEVILPVPVPKLFTYRVPFEFNELVLEGQRIIVPFGQRNVLTGVIKQIHQQPPKDYDARYVLDLLEAAPAFNSIMLKFLDWVGSYYMANPGDVLGVAMPSGLKVSSESLVQLNPSYQVQEELASDEEMLINYLSEHEHIPFQEIPHLVGKKSINKLIKSLLDKEAILLFDKIRERFSPKTSTYLKLNPELLSETELQNVFERIAKKPKQEEVLLAYLQSVPALGNPSLNALGLKKEVLLRAGCSPSSIKTLESHGILISYQRIESRFEENLNTVDAPPLSKDQQKVLEQILASFEQKPITLLHGITGSGKTEIYLNLIQQVIDNGQQVLFLVPEIALTTQLVIRLRKVLGSQVGVYHSRFSDNERVEVWQGVQNGKYPFVIGVRSSLFLPFDNLGLIIIDEEHEPSYKQMDPSPRYHARDAALMLANLHHARVLLGSATPSVESYYHARQGRYGLVELDKRFGNAVLPQVEIADISREKKKKTMKGHITSHLFEAVGSALSRNNQVIIFQNRRGYAPYLSCSVCGWTPHCTNCDVSLTYHMFKNELRCHYCGYSEALPPTCEACGSAELQAINYGTEQLEESLKLLLPENKVARMDQDTTQGKHTFDKLIDDFANRRIDLLVGTQMVAKGLDFDHVTLVGIFDIDRMIHFPDFRSSERTFQLATQVAGRAGRRKEQGKVIIQTYNPDQTLLRHIARQDYKAFYEEEIKEREQFRYPPFVRLIKLTVRHKEARLVSDAAYLITDLLRQTITSEQIYGPIQPVIGKIRNKYLQEVLIKIDRSNPQLNQLKLTIWKCTRQVIIRKDFKGVQVIFNIDPV
ncbi:MAG: primosomal protein N' [Cyclobacteriaceae bacterium]|nr:primosomal protein N' [Cyclobacteriaceae bacterium]